MDISSQEKNIMEYNFNILIDRLLDANFKITNTELSEKLSTIKNSCICIGTGGSFAVSIFASKVLNAMNRYNNNKIISIYAEPLDIAKNDFIDSYSNILTITYSNNNYGIDLALKKAKENGLNIYVLTSNAKKNNTDVLISYSLNYPKEYSFISITSTLSPITLLLKHYLNAAAEEIICLIKKLYNKSANNKILENNCKTLNTIKNFEIMSDYDANTSAHILERTLVEAGLGVPVIHDKYSYCHGRSTLNHHTQNSVLVYLINGKKTELDNILINTFYEKKSYKDIIILQTDYENKIIGECDLAFMSLFFCKEIAISLNKSLSKVEYSPLVKKIYKYEGEM